MMTWAARIFRNDHTNWNILRAAKILLHVWKNSVTLLIRIEISGTFRASCANIPVVEKKTCLVLAAAESHHLKT